MVTKLAPKVQIEYITSAGFVTWKRGVLKKIMTIKNMNYKVKLHI